MPYLILAAGLLFGLYGLYRFFLKADTRQMRAFFIALGVGAAIIAMLLLALTGRLAAALGLLAVLLPFFMPWLRRKLGVGPPPQASAENAPPPAAAGPMNRTEALAVLGLAENEMSADNIREAHRKLIKKLHPDQEGSAWLAAKINQARDFLLDHVRENSAP